MSHVFTRFCTVVFLLTAGSLLLKAQTHTDSTRHHSLVRETVRNFDRFDTNYIEPQHYIYTVMLQVTHN